jgi:hypothetical protein
MTDHVLFIGGVAFLAAVTIFVILAHFTVSGRK